MAAEGAAVVVRSDSSLENVGQPADNGRVRILLVDDHPLVRQGLARLIARQPDWMVCGEAGDREGTLAAIGTKPEVVILDLSLADSGGLDLIKEIHDREPGIVILVLSMHDDSLYAEPSIRLGARGYISKQEPASQLLQAIRKVLAGEIYLSEQVAAQIASRTARSARGANASPLDRLSRRERQIFDLIGSGFSTGQIADSIKISASTVETHRTRIKGKMNLRDAPELLRTAIRWHVSRKLHSPMAVERVK